ncbi:Octaprenyl diphosphate synthase [Vulgatibacter incomptus]|uniref:Octaprenyl diphosphate synthase n=1 Tax=Vulgatibacter incomptus TaxID=1391653 RepID=A0A0K1P8H0_9BACT|nr:Octaprenyl diphosphate synthase [Vulgatibacter incomptus]
MIRSTDANLARVAEEKGVPRSTAHLDAARMADEELIRLEAALPRLCAGAPPELGAAAEHLLVAGGKRVRALLTLLSARAAGGSGGVALAAAAELAHAATLLHDDVIDEGDVRRGRPTSRLLWSNAVSVLSGDFLLTRSLDLACGAGVPGALEELIAVLRELVCGEALQLSMRGSVEATEAEYRRVVEGKTASLFRWAARSGCRTGGGSARMADAMGEYGWHVGIAFQLSDDALDFDADPGAFGKSLLQDLREGTLTLPVLRTLEMHPALREDLRAAMAADKPLDDEVASRIARIVRESGAVQAVRDEAAAEAEAGAAALSLLPDNVYRRALEDVARGLAARVR